MPDPALDSVSVDILLYSVSLRGPDERAQRLALRRVVYVHEAAVEELWLSGKLPSLRSTIAAVRRIGNVGARVVLGEPLDGIPGMSLPDEVMLAELANEMEQADGRVDLLVTVRGRVVALGGRRRLAAADVTSAATFTGWAGREVMVQAIKALRLRVGSDGQDDPNEVAAEALKVDIQEARSRSEQMARWQHIRLAERTFTMEPYSLLVHDVQRTVQWIHGERLPQTDLGIDPATDSIVAVFIEVQGGQIGRGNRQVNLWRYRLEPTIDLRAVLARPEVREAFALAATEPSASTREAAVEALGSAITGGRTDWGRGEPRHDSLRPLQNDEIATAAGTILICDCRGIQVGNRMRQYNTFASVLTPTVAAHELFLVSPDLAEVIVDYAIGGDGLSYRTVQDRLADAVCGAADSALGHPSREGLFTWGSTVRGVEGVSLGEDIRQTDVLELAARVPRAIKGALDETSRRAEEARQREEAHRQERERIAQLYIDPERSATDPHDRYCTRPSEPRRGDYRDGPSLSM